MLQELSVVEQRYLAVREVLEGARVTDVATRYGVDRRTVHRWLVRYATEGLGALSDRSSRPDRCPHQIAPEVEARIVALRRTHPGWGPRTILTKLRRELEQPPSRSSIYRCLLRHRLIDHKPRRRRAQDYRRWERSRPMELWQMDVMGGVMLEDGTELKAITGIDDHSRYCVIAKLVARATARPVCEALVEALSRHGAPEQILTDNAKVFTGRLAHQPATVAFDRICLANGIRHILTAPYSPTTTGKIERLHKTIRKELLADRTFTMIEQAQAELDAWVARYNSEREHQAIGDVAPARRFELVHPDATEVIDPEAEIHDEPPSSRSVARRVDRAGRISILKHRYHVGRHLASQQVDVESVDGLLHVSHDGVLVATHARRHLPEDDERMDRRAKASRPARPTRGEEVLRKVDTWGSVSFAGTGYRVGNRYAGQIVGVRVVDDTVQITQDGLLLRTHRARHDTAKEFGALANPGGRPRRIARDVA
ncbi:MAG TPA: IS481 family transposase [Acidimicrobiia bacterium]|nr:IS481 family transposase [Acidimicrobiia bacterium]